MKIKKWAAVCGGSESRETLVSQFDKRVNLVNSIDGKRYSKRLIQYKSQKLSKIDWNINILEDIKDTNIDITRICYSAKILSKILRNSS